MYEATNIYKSILFIYPKSYKAKFAQEMVYVFEDMYTDEIQQHGKVSYQFWQKILMDTLKSVIREHIKTLNWTNLIGIILLMPFALLFLIDFISRLIQRDLVHYNRTTYAAISQTIIYKNPKILFAFAILFPALAVIINLLNFRKLNLVGILIILLGVGALTVILGHDYAPCFITGLLYHGGLGNLNQIFSVCTKA